MRSILLPILFFSISNSLITQCPIPSAMEWQDGNDIKAQILNGGDLFWNGGDAQFITTPDSELPVSSIFTAGLGLGGYDLDGNLKVAAQLFGRNNLSFDFAPGPLTNNGSIDEIICQNFDKIWKVTREEIEAHKADFADNGIIDFPIESIYKWPGRSSFHFYSYNGFTLPNDPNDFAPFHDTNNDQIYNPDHGDFPHPPNTIHSLAPVSMTWSVFNDNTIHLESQANPLKVEIQLTSWSFDCHQNTQLNKTVFTSHKVINKSGEAIHDMKIALWVDFDLGCFSDDYMGSAPERNACYVYNQDPIDGDYSADYCFGVSTYGYTPGAQSITFLNQPMNSFMMHGYNQGGCFPISEMGEPVEPIHFYNLMNSKWRDGTPLIYGGVGYDWDSTGTPTNHIYSSNPNDSDGWSMHQMDAPGGEPRSIASTSIDILEHLESFQLDIAYTFHQYSHLDHLEIVDQMYDEIEQVQQMYDMQFNSWCGVYTAIDELKENETEVTIYPNPSTGIFNLNTKGLEIIDLSLADINGRIVWRKSDGTDSHEILNFKDLAKGIYFLNVSTSEGNIPKKLIIQ